MGAIDTLNVNCRKASILIERRDLRPLTLFERIGLGYHLRICGACKAYERHSALIDRWLEERRDESALVDADVVRERIFRRLELPR